MVLGSCSIHQASLHKHFTTHSHIDVIIYRREIYYIYKKINYIYNNEKKNRTIY